MQALGISPTSIDPVVATIFAVQSRSLGTNPGVYFGEMNAFAKSLGMGNTRVLLEREVAVPLSPALFAKLAPSRISVDKARAILKQMGIDIPEGLSADGATQILESTRRLTAQEIRAFIEQAGK